MYVLNISLFLHVDVFFFTSSFVSVLGVPYEVGQPFGRDLLAPVPHLLHGFVESGGSFHTSLFSAA